MGQIGFKMAMYFRARKCLFRGMGNRYDFSQPSGTGLRVKMIPISLLLIKLECDIYFLYLA